MLNTFPFFLTYSLVAPLILRVILGCVFLYAGYSKIAGRDQTPSILSSLGLPATSATARTLGFAEAIGGIALIAGFLTQIAAILVLVISLGGLFVKIRQSDLIKQSIGFYLLSTAISVSLILSGAGFLAFDLPL